MATTNSNKITTLAQLQMLAEKVKSEDAALGAKIAAVSEELESLSGSVGEANILNGVKVNGKALGITDKMVDIIIKAGEDNGTLTVGDATVAITGLQALAYKANISESDLDAALKASIAAKATDADLKELTVRVESAEGDIKEIQGDIKSLKEAGYQTSTQVQSAIQSAIAATKHASFEKADEIPSKETAQPNVMYLVKNDETECYDIYALVEGEVVRLDDTTVDLTNYVEQEDLQQAIDEAIEALNMEDYAKAAELTNALSEISKLDGKFASYYTKEEMAGVLEGYATDTEAQGYASAAVEAARASDDDVSAMLNETFTVAEE